MRLLFPSRDVAHRVWNEAGLKPHRIERCPGSDHPDFGSKAADFVGLYLDPPQHAAVFCVDEKTASQAQYRLDSVLPHSPGRAERRVCGVPQRGGRTGASAGVHIILDNLSAHKGQVVRDFLATHPNVHFQVTPTYSP